MDHREWGTRVGMSAPEEAAPNIAPGLVLSPAAPAFNHWHFQTLLYSVGCSSPQISEQGQDICRMPVLSRSKAAVSLPPG